ncbi:MAG: hypothetical protein ACJ73N_14680 [Bryobacteraceae bacterium]
MVKILGTCFLLALAAHKLPAQGFVQISSIRVHPQKLTCVGTAGIGFVRVQVYVAGLAKAAKQSAATVELALYSTRPAESKLNIRDASQEISLQNSPAVVDFEISCNTDTLPGEIALGAAISGTPDGVQIREPAREPVIGVLIERSK